MKTSHGLKLLPYLRPYRLRFLWALAQVFLIAGFELLKPWPLQVVIDNVLRAASYFDGPLPPQLLGGPEHETTDVSGIGECPLATHLS